MFVWVLNVKECLRLVHNIAFVVYEVVKVVKGSIWVTHELELAF